MDTTDALLQELQAGLYDPLGDSYLGEPSSITSIGRGSRIPIRTPTPTQRGNVLPNGFIPFIEADEDELPGAGAGRGHRSPYQPFQLPIQREAEPPAAKRTYNIAPNPSTRVVRIRPSDDGNRDRSPSKGYRAAAGEYSEFWHRGPAPVRRENWAREAAASPVLARDFHNTEFLSNRVNQTTNYSDIVTAANDVHNIGLQGTWSTRGWLGAKTGESQLPGNRQERILHAIDTLEMASTKQGPMQDDYSDFALKADFMPAQLIITTGEDGQPPHYQQSGRDNYPEYYEDDETEEELPQAELESLEEATDPQEINYYDQLLRFRVDMDTYRKDNPTDYPDYLRKVVAAGLPREHHEYFRQQIKEIDDNGGELPEVSRKKYKKERKRKKNEAAEKQAADRANHPDLTRSNSKGKKDRKNKKEKKEKSSNPIEKYTDKKAKKAKKELEKSMKPDKLLKKARKSDGFADAQEEAGKAFEGLEENTNDKLGGFGGMF